DEMLVIARLRIVEAIDGGFGGGDDVAVVEMSLSDCDVRGGRRRK
ncbi:hypothetical protein L195_g064057, partial [Trifolium pratense]